MGQNAIICFECNKFIDAGMLSSERRNSYYELYFVKKLNKDVHFCIDCAEKIIKSSKMQSFCPICDRTNTNQQTTVNEFLLSKRGKHALGAAKLVDSSFCVPCALKFFPQNIIKIFEAELSKALKETEGTK